MVHLYKAINKNYEQNGDYTLNSIISSLFFNGGIKDIWDIQIEVEYDENNIWENIDKWDVIKLDTPMLKDQKYRIYRYIQNDDNLTLYARPLFYDLAKKILLDTRNVNANGQEAINKALEGTGYTGTSNITERRNCNWIKKNIVNALMGNDDYSFTSNYKGELWIDNFNIALNNAIGGDYGVQCSYGTNIRSIEKDISIDKVYTRIIPYADNNLMLLETYVDSPLINNYPLINELSVSMDDIKIGTEEGQFANETLARDEMKRRCLLMFSEDKIDIPPCNFRIGIESLVNTTEYNNFTDLNEIGLGDVVRVYYKPLGIDLVTRCLNIKCEYNFALKQWEYNEVELGDAKEDFTDKFNNSLNNSNNSNDKIDNILTDGNIRAELVKGFLNAQKTTIKATKDIAQKMNFRAFLLEDLDDKSPNYGAMLGGTNMIGVTKKRTLDNKDWDFENFEESACMTVKGLRANMLYGKTIIGENMYLENVNGYFSIDNNGIRIRGANFLIEGSDGVSTDIGSMFKITKDSIDTKVSSGEEFSTEYQQNSESFNYNIGNDGTGVKISKDGLRIKNGSLQVQNSNGQTTIDGTKYMHNIEMYGNGAIVIPDGQKRAIVTIPHGKGYAPDFKAEWLDLSGTVFSDPFTEYGWDDIDGNHSVTMVARVSVDTQNLYIEARRRYNSINGTKTLYYRYFILGGVKY